MLYNQKMNLVDSILFISLVVTVCFVLLQELDCHRLTKPGDKDLLRKRVRNAVLVFLAACAACFVCQFTQDHFGDVLTTMFNTTPQIQRDRVQVFTENPNW